MTIDHSRESIAHAVQDTNGDWKLHLLKDHLYSTARLAGEFASSFGNRDWGEILGCWHDIGKFHPAWQAYLKRKTGYDPEAHIEGKTGSPNHSTAGALLAYEKGNHQPPARILPYALAAHHAGLADWYGNLQNRLHNAVDELTIIKSIAEATEIIQKNLPLSIPCILKNRDPDSAEFYHLWIRMLFSCLVDADFLDTEQFMEPEKSAIRSQYISLQELKQRFDRYIIQKEQHAADNWINKKRKEIRLQCETKASLPSGFFSLNVPTGGGKTLSSMAFALEHAIRHNKSRIIYAIPYTSIIEQTANIFKYGTDDAEAIRIKKEKGDFLFGEDPVLEHHSNLEPEKETAKNRLAAQNWDAPVIVTTNVQLFESLFASRVSSCRKLHNIVNSIIILDEVQMLPPEYLKPILSVLKGLVRYFGVTVVLMTATQPALEGRIGQPPHVLNGLENVTPIIDNPNPLAQDFKRVEFIFPADLNLPKQWEEVKNELIQHEQVLCIVNSRKDCRDLHALMPEGTMHLSALMCGEDRSFTISEIRKKLAQGESVRVISTQLIEAGVDIDFPVVYRALAGLDSIAQAAGRCNREDKLATQGKKGKTVVFIPPRPSPIGLIRKGEDACKEMLRNHTVDTISPDLFISYFRHFYSRLNEVDKPKFYERLVRDAPLFEFQFRTLADEFHLIDDHQISIVVYYKNPVTGSDSSVWIQELRKNRINRDLMRKLQRFFVNVPIGEFRKLHQSGLIEEISGYWVLCDENSYKPGLGLFISDTFNFEQSVI